MANEEEFKQALAEAERGGAEAMVVVAGAYFQGNGTAANPEQGMFWLQKAAAGGNAEAQNLLAEIFKEWIAEAGKGGADSQIAAGSAYLKGIGTEVDFKQAVFWFKKAAARGDITMKITAKSCLLLAEAMLPARNFRELLEGAQKGNANFQYSLGFAYLKGLGTAVNARQAAFWFEKAAGQGHAEARQVFLQVQTILTAGGENFDNIVPIVANKGGSGKHSLIWGVILAVAVSYLATGLDIGWLHSLAIFFNISWILYLALTILVWIMGFTRRPKLVLAVYSVLAFLFLILLIGFNVHYIKGRKTGNPVSIVLQNPIEAARKRFFGAGKDKTEEIFSLDLKSENGAAKIFKVYYGKEETVISLVRTTGSHKAVGIAGPGEANSFYVKDVESGETWPLKETRPQDYEEAAGIDLVFDPFESRSFDLVEGNDTSNTAWHFRNVTAGGEF
jgi:TPR repeat protein